MKSAESVHEPPVRRALSRADIMAEVQAKLDAVRRFKEAGLINKNGDFYPTGVHYPPITMYPPITDAEFYATYQLPADGLLDIYLHIPFCASRCLFCHYPLKLGYNQEKEKDRYLDAYEKEMDLVLNRLGLKKFKVRSILAGGGTPTFLTLDQQKRFLDMCAERMDLSTLTQYNYDVDPNTLIGPEGAKRLELLKQYKVDRLTIGVQSLNDEILRLMNRHHRAAEAREAIRDCLAAGFQVDIEFIFGYPGQTLDNWIEVMEEAVTLGVPEIQLYRLKIDAYGDYQGPVRTYIEKHPELLPTNDVQFQMKAAAIAILNANGYHENLRRVFTKRREDFSHYADNQCCQLRDEIGMGLTAFSSLHDRYCLNTQYWEEYYGNIAAGKLPINRGLVRNLEEQIRWATILPLKNRDIYKPRFLEVTGVPFEKVFRAKFQRLMEYGLVEDTGDVMKLTKLGAFFADEVAQQFENVKYLPFPPEAYADGPLHPLRDNNPF